MKIYTLYTIGFGTKLFWEFSIQYVAAFFDGLVTKTHRYAAAFLLQGLYNKKGLMVINDNKRNFVIVSHLWSG
jgi:hypothetical protein